MDGAAYFAVVRTCKRWRELIETVHVWSKIVASFRNKIPKKVWEWLPNDYELERYLEVHNAKELTPLNRLKITYKILATACLVVPEFSLEGARQLISEGTCHHRPLRQERVFSSINTALQYSRAGEYLFLNEGTYDEAFTVDTPVHISGRVSQRSERERVANLLVAKLSRPVTFNCPSRWASLICCHLPRNVKIEINNSSFVALQSLVFHGDCYISVGKQSVLRMWRCGLERVTRSVTIDEDFGYVDMHDCFFGMNNFCQTDLIKIIHKFRETIESPAADPSIAIGCINSFSALSRMKSPLLRPCFEEEQIVTDLRKGIAKFKTNPQVILAALQTMIRMLLTEEPCMINTLETWDVVPILKEVAEIHQGQCELQKWIAISLRNFLNQSKCLHRFRDESLYYTCLDTMNNFIDESSVVFEIISFLWHSVHFLLPIRTLVVKELPRIVQVLDKHSNDAKLYKEVLGLIWNLSGTWPDGITCYLIPHLVRAFKLFGATEYSTAHILLGSFLIITRRATTEEIDHLVDNNVVTYLLEVKTQVPPESEAEYRFWKAIAIISKSLKAQRVLTDLIARNLKYPPLTDLDKVKIARSLTIHKEMDDRLYYLLQQMILMTKDAEIFFIAMDAVVHLLQNEALRKDKSKIQTIGKQMLERAKQFTHSRKVRDWVGWADLYINNSNRESGFGFDPHKSMVVHISKDNLVIRHEFWGTFGSAIVSTPVTKGKWYYEAELLTVGLFFVGWANDKFRPEPYEGIGVGSDEHSWAVDLKKHTIRHTNEDGSVRLPYAKDVDPEVGGIVQCYLDLDKSEMSFGYNGVHLDVAFRNFNKGSGLYAAVSTNLENECRLNFGNTPFRYPPKSEYRALYKSKKKKSFIKL